MQKKFRVERITNPEDTRLIYAHRELLQRYFSPGEVEPIGKIQMLIEKANDKTAKNPLVLMIAYHPIDENNPASLVSGNIINGDEECFGAIGYTVTLESLRKQGLASSLVDAFEGEVRDHHQNSRLIIMEGKRSSSGFWEKKGYLKVLDGKRNVNYCQSPLDFDPKTGEPLYEEVKETLRAKPLQEKKTEKEELRHCLLKSLEGISREWFTPKREKFETGEAYQRAMEYAEKVIQRNLESIRKSSKLRLGK